MRTLIALAFGLACAVPAAAEPEAADPVIPKKLIEYGWDVPSPVYVASHIRQMEQRPFDGLMMSVGAVRDVFATKELDEAALNADMGALAQIRWERFTDNFITVLARSEMDWFSDEDWQWVQRNIGLCARAARIGRCVGLTFDAEPYGDSPWDYAAQPRASEKSFEQYQAITRTRGAQFMAAIEAEFPSPVIHTFYLLALFEEIAREPDPAKRQAALKAHPYGLFPAFINGMLEAASPGTVITDGNEHAYYYTKPLDYYQAYHTVHQTSQALVEPALRPKYRAQVQCAQALYVDHVFGLRGGKSVASYLSDDERAQWFEHNVYHALRSSDRYVWLYSEKMNWWTDTGLPPGLEQAVVSAREKAATDQPLQTDVAAMVEAAQRRMRAEIERALIRRSATIVRIGRDEQPPVIDGRLDDPIWLVTSPLEPFNPTVMLSDSLTAQTQVRTRWDSGRLYLAIHCAEPNMSGLSIQGTQRDDPVWSGDSVDIFLARSRQGEFAHFIISPTGVVWDARQVGLKPDLTWNPEYERGTALAGDSWTVELAIPWRSLGVGAPSGGDSFLANICRSRPQSREYSSWSQTIQGFQEPEQFGEWRLE